MSLDAKNWEEVTDHPWVGKSAGVERVNEDDRVPGTIKAIWRYEGETECVVVALDSVEEDVIVGQDRVEVLT